MQLTMVHIEQLEIYGCLKKDFYDIHENPPKATVRISTTTGTSTVNSSDFDVNVDTLLNGILETIYGQEDNRTDTNKTETTGNGD